MPASPTARSPRPLLLVAAALLLVTGIYALARWAAAGEVMGSVTVLDVELGGTTPEVARAALTDLEERLASLPARVVIEGTELDVLPAQAGFDLDEPGLVEEAMAVGRTGNPVSDFVWWLTHLTGSTPLPPQASLNPEALEAMLDEMDDSVIGNPPFEGSVELEDGSIVARYPRPGRRVARDPARELLIRNFLDPQRPPVELPVRDEAPVLSAAEIDAEVAEAELMLSAPVVLTTEDDLTLTFSVDDLRAAFVSRTETSPPAIHLGFDPEALEPRLAEVRPEFESAPVSARFEISGYEVSILPGRNGTLLEADDTAQVLAAAARTSLRRAGLPLVEGAEPEVTTADLEALDIHHLVAQFTTYHDCCAARVTNIHLIADEVDGAIVAPGEQFSLNDHVGPRTEEEGYLPAGTIIGGEIEDTVGGGVSQFATTFYNAVFWGGYEDVTHKPHSFWFDRYPEGIEATISWPLPDLVFRNDDESGVLIKTEYTDTSITVKFYGNNEGRILAGDNVSGNMSVGVIVEGGPGAKQVRGDRSERFDFREPPAPLYRGNPELDVDEEDVVQSPAEGWSLTVTRTITIGDETITQEWPVRYLPRQEIIEVHPCKVPDATESCPTTTTTTTSTVPPSTEPPTTSTTAPPDSTTTTAAG